MSRLVIFIILLICFTGSYAQHRTFLLVSVNNDNSPVKGFYLRTGDSTLVLVKGKDTIELNYRNIQSVKTGKSTGHDIFLGIVIGASAGAIIGLATYRKPDPGIISIDFGPGASTGLGLVAGALTGVIIGTVHGSLKHREKFEVKGLYQNWLDLKGRLPQ